MCERERERRQLSVSERQRGYILLRDIHTYIHFKFKKKINRDVDNNFACLGKKMS